MKKFLLTGLVGDKASHEGFRLLHEKNLPRLQAYAKKWGFILRVISGPVPQGAGRISGHPTWLKFGYYLESLRHEMDLGDSVVWIDADSVLVRADYDLTPRRNFAISIEPRGTVNAGVIGWRKGSFSNRLINTCWNMLDEDILPGLPNSWVDQPAIITFIRSLSRWQAWNNIQYYPIFVNATGPCELMPSGVYRKIVVRHFAGNAPIEWSWFNRPLAGL